MESGCPYVCGEPPWGRGPGGVAVYTITAPMATMIPKMVNGVS